MRYFFKTFGCRVNQYETQRLRETVLASGGAAVEAWTQADVCVLNTCTVTAEADKDALSLARRISRRNPAARLIVTGCLATRDAAAVRRAAPGAVIVGNEGKQSIPAALGCSAAPSGLTRFDGKSRAFVKIQDGCNMACAFCVIPSIRPALSSRALAEVLDELAALADAGYAEAVLCGVRLGRWRGAEGGRPVDLSGLIERALSRRPRLRLRLSSLEITDLTERLIELMASSGGGLRPSVHAPLQSGSSPVLRRMRRWYSADFYARRVQALRARLPRASVFADVIAGFPGETRAQHEETLRFIERLGLSGLHVFRYSARPGTEAAGLEALPPAEVEARARELRALDARLRERFAASWVGQTREAVVELGGREALTEDFLTVTLEEPCPPGAGRVRVAGARDGRAFGGSCVVGG